MRKRICYIHVWPHKTGTTSIQWFLQENGADFLKHGFSTLNDAILIIEMALLRQFGLVPIFIPALSAIGQARLILDFLAIRAGAAVSVCNQFHRGSGRPPFRWNRATSIWPRIPGISMSSPVSASSK
jgi:hypothetical protein